MKNLDSRAHWPRLPLLAPLLAIAFALILVVPASAATVLNETTAFGGGGVLNPCNGEILTFSGTDHVTLRRTDDGNGGVHVGQHHNIHVTAIGDQGNTYEGNGEDTFELNGRVGYEETATHTGGPFEFNEISQGSAPNFVAHAVFHTTFHPDGTVTADVVHFTTECRG